MCCPLRRARDLRRSAVCALVAAMRLQALRTLDATKLKLSSCPATAAARSRNHHHTRMSSVTAPPRLANAAAQVPQW
jgi:hypothetical protein